MGRRTISKRRAKELLESGMPELSFSALRNLRKDELLLVSCALLKRLCNIEAEMNLSGPGPSDEDHAAWIDMHNEAATHAATTYDHALHALVVGGREPELDDG